MVVKKFEVGKYYRLVGVKTRLGWWNMRGLMDFLLDGKPHKVIKVKENGLAAVFENQPHDEFCPPDNAWLLICELEDNQFEEVTAPAHRMRPTLEDGEWFIMFIVFILFLIVLFRLTVVGG